MTFDEKVALWTAVEDAASAAELRASSDPGSHQLLHEAKQLRAEAERLLDELLTLTGVDDAPHYR